MLNFFNEGSRNDVAFVGSFLVDREQRSRRNVFWYVAEMSPVFVSSRIGKNHFIYPRKWGAGLPNIHSIAEGTTNLDRQETSPALGGALWRHK